MIANAIEAQNQIALQFAVKACVDLMGPTAAHPIACACCSKPVHPAMELNFPMATTKLTYCCAWHNWLTVKQPRGNQRA